MALNKLMFQQKPQYSFNFPGGIWRAQSHWCTSQNPCNYLLGEVGEELVWCKTSVDSLKKWNDPKEGGAVLVELFSKQTIRSLAFDEDAKFLAVGTWEGDVKIYNWEKRKPKRIPLKDETSLSTWMGVKHLRFVKGPSGQKRLLVQLSTKFGMEGDELHWVTLDDAGKIKKSEEFVFNPPINSEIDAIDIDSSQILIGSRDRKVRVYDYNGVFESEYCPFTKDNVANIEEDRRFFSSIKGVFLSDSTKPKFDVATSVVATGLSNGDIHIFHRLGVMKSGPGIGPGVCHPAYFNMRSLSKNEKNKEHYTEISGLDIFQQNNQGRLLLAASSLDHSGSIIDVNQLFQEKNTLPETSLQEEVLLMKVHISGMNDLRFTSSGRQIITISEDGTAKLWFTTVKETYEKLFGQ